MALYEKKKAQLKNLSTIFGEKRTRQMNALEPMVHEITSAAAMLTRAFSRNAMKEKKRKEKEDNTITEKEDNDIKQKKRKENKMNEEQEMSAPAQLDPQELTLTLELMRDNNYPIPAEHRAAAERPPQSRQHETKTGNTRVEFRSTDPVNTDGFVQTQPASGADAADNVFYDMLAMDCEMCMTKEGLELTRMSIVAGDGKVVVDTLVLPRNEITDYNTRYSGITEKMLENVTTRLEDAQAMMLKVCRAETFLIGHSLENDLVALRVMHLNVCDTSILYTHSRGPPFKPALRHLSEKFLGRKIQETEHCSIQDAQATMDLMQLKLKHGHAFGGPDSGNEMLCDKVSKAGKRSVLIDRKRILQRFATGNTSAVPVVSDAEAASIACKQAKNALNSFLWVQFTGLADVFEATAKARRYAIRQVISNAGSSIRAASTSSAAALLRHNETTRTTSADDGSGGGDGGGRGGIEIERVASSSCTAVDDESVDAILARVDSWIGDIYGAMPTNSILVLASGQGNTAHTRTVSDEKHKRLRNSPGLMEWNEEAETKFRFVCNDSKRAVCFVVVKEPV